MKYNTLLAFRYFLEKSERVNKNATALTYYKAMDFLLTDHHILDCRKMDIEKVMNKLRAMKYKNVFLYFCDFISLELPKDTKLEIENMNKDKIKKRRKLKKVKLKDIKK